MLTGGDHATDSRGIPITLTGERELIQRALLRLSIKKGSFPQDLSLGSELYKLREPRGGNRLRLALSYVQEALLPIPEITVAGVTMDETGFEALRLAVSLEIAENTYQLEVDVA